MDGSFRGPGHIDSGKREPLTGQFKRLEKKKGPGSGVLKEGGYREPQPSPTAPQRRPGALRQ